MFSLRRAILIALLAGCAPAANGAKTGDMSAAEHEAAARREVEQARAHARDESVAQSDESPYDSFGTEAGAAERHWERAAEHGAAARALREAEIKACAQVPELERKTGPFSPSSRVVSVQALRQLKTGAEEEMIGAAILLRPEPGLTAQAVDQSLKCQLARAARLGHEGPELGQSPLALRNIETEVVGTTSGFTVVVTSDEPDVGREIYRRARLLVRRPDRPMSSH